MRRFATSSLIRGALPAGKIVVAVNPAGANVARRR